MILNTSLAQEIVNKTMKVIKRNINIIDDSGIIIGSSTPARLNTFHQGALKVIKTSQTVELSRDDVKDMEGTQPGINLPIFFNSHLLGVVGITGEPDEVRNYGEIMKMLVETMIQQSLIKEQIDIEKRAIQNLIQEILNSNIEDKEDTLIARGYILGYDLSLTRIPIIIDIEGAKPSFKSSNKSLSLDEYNRFFIRRLKDSVFNCISDNICNELQDIPSHVVGSTFVIFKRIPDSIKKKMIKDYCYNFCEKIKSTLSEKFSLQATIAVGPNYSGILGIKNSYKDALGALDIGKRLKGTGGIYFVNDVGIGFLLNSIPKSQINIYLQQVFNCNTSITDLFDDTLKETLTALFINNLNLTETAKALYIHRNTLLYRIKNIIKATNKDPRNFDDAVELKLLMILGKLNSKS